MLKWKRNKYGGSHPEGLDRLDSAPSRKTKSCKITITAGSKSSSKCVQRKSNSHFTRSISEMDLSRLNYNNENETYTPIRRASFRSAIPDNVMSPSMSSPYVSTNSQLEDIYQRFAERASISAPASPQSDEDIATIMTPKQCRQNNCGGSLRRTSPTCLPCIEEAAENDELISIPDSGICDDEYDRTKHYFEPLKFHDDERLNHSEYLPSPHLNNNNSSFNNTSEQPKKYSPLPRSYSLSAINMSTHQRLTKELASSHEPINNSPFEYNSRNSSRPIDIDNNKNTDLCDSTLGQKPIKNQDPHSLISSMLWNGNTSNRPPSSTGIYSTVPPNRYGQRNKDLMSRLTSTPTSSTPSTPSSSSPPSPTSPGRKSPTSPKEFKVSLDVSHYGPDEILVTLEDGKLVVNGKHFSNSEYGFESLQFHRRYPIPEGIKKADIKSTITDDGILIINGRVGTPEPRSPISDVDRLSDYENSPSPKSQRAVSSGHTTPELMSSGEHKVTVSPSLSRRSLVTSDYSEESQSRHSDDSRSLNSTISDSDFRETDENSYVLNVNCRGYDPQDLDIKIQSRELVIHGRQKVCSVENGHERVRHKEFTKRYSVPRYANCHRILSKFTEDEQLVVEIQKSSTIKRGGVVREDILDAE